ncbi:MAG: hypothetical protein PHC64_05860 [Candidatus Gastranaerophilales bacterium]|nr:hypothetical protein [Candidatus Gastranaerophilales bacterium]
MAFLALAIEKSSLIVQKTQLEYQQMILCEELNQITEEMQDLVEAADDDCDITDTAAYQALEWADEQYSAKKDTIEAQLMAINQEIEGYGKAVTDNIKNECKLTISA